MYTNASGASVGDVVTITCPEGFEAVAGDARVECHADAFGRGRWYLPYAAEDGAVAAPEAETPAPLLCLSLQLTLNLPVLLCSDAPGDGKRRQFPRPPSTKDDDV